MKKSLTVLSVLSLSAALSACSSDYMDHHDGHMWGNDSCRKEHMHVMAKYYFDKMDTDNDGMVSKKEYMTFARKMFNEADTNHDGMLTMEELKAQKMKEKREMKEQMDNVNCDSSSQQSGMGQETNPSANQEMNQNNYSTNQNRY